MNSPRANRDLVLRLIAAMRIQISHTTDYRFDPPAAGVIQTLRLTPRHHDGQYVLDWHLDLSVDCRLDRNEDAFGNIIHSFATDGPLDHLIVKVEGEVDTRDTSGLVAGAVERFPPRFSSARPT